MFHSLHVLQVSAGVSGCFLPQFESTTIFPDGCKQAANGLPGGLSDGVSARALGCSHDKWMVRERDPGGVMHANTQSCVSMFYPYAS